LASIPLGGIRLRVSRPIKYLQHSSKPITGGGKRLGGAIVRKKGGEFRKYPEQELGESRWSGLGVDFKRNGALYQASKYILPETQLRHLTPKFWQEDAYLMKGALRILLFF
jgi:hypothetical protein